MSGKVGTKENNVMVDNVEMKIMDGSPTEDNEDDLIHVPADVFYHLSETNLVSGKGGL